MPLVKTYGIVLRYANFSETSRMVTLFTPGMGRISAAAKGCRRPKSPLFNGCELYTFGEYILRENRDRYLMTQVSVVESFYALRNNLDTLTCASQIREVAEVMLTEGQPRPQLFVLTARCLAALCQEENDPWMISLYYQMQALQLEGLFPQIDRCCECGAPLEESPWYSCQAGGALCPICRLRYADAHTVLPGTLASMRLLLGADLERVRILRLSKQIRPQLEELWRETLFHQLEQSFGAVEFVHKLRDHVYHPVDALDRKKDPRA